MAGPQFLSTQAILVIHAELIVEHGGDGAVRDQGLLESACAQPVAALGGNYLHDDIFMMAAAYLFHIVMNHPFVDGKKRAGLASALTFLELNGCEMTDDDGQLADTVLEMIAKKRDKVWVAEQLRRYARRN